MKMNPAIEEPIIPSTKATKPLGAALTVSGDDEFKCEPLTGGDLKHLCDLEDIIQHSLANFIQTGEALAEIQHYHLYRKEYKTFEEYLHGRWGIGKAHGYRLISAAKIAKVLDCKDSVRPSHEAQVRPMTVVEIEKVPQIWKLAIDKANGNPITEEIVKKAVREVLGKKESKPETRKLSWREVAQQAGILLKRTRDVSIILQENQSVKEAMEYMDRIEWFLEVLANNGE